MSATPDRPAPTLPGRERLPSGRHGLTREAVVASQRGRLIEAMAQVVTEKGYGPATVADVVERAGVSRRTFYEQFADKEACFLAVYSTGAEVLLTRIRQAVEPLPEAGWRARARAGVETTLAVLAEEPDFAWATQIEILGAGPAALERRAAVLGVFAEMWRSLHARARQEEPDRVPELPAEVFTILTGGIEEVVRERLRTQGAASLPGLADPVLRAVLAILGDRPA
ncbi:MAG: TetR/AcrR family transcriptional regulator [Acidimicrobiia bacterium]